MVVAVEACQVVAMVVALAIMADGAQLLTAIAAVAMAAVAVDIVSAIAVVAMVAVVVALASAVPWDLEVLAVALAVVPAATILDNALIAAGKF